MPTPAGTGKPNQINGEFARERIESNVRHQLIAGLFLTRDSHFYLTSGGVFENGASIEDFVK